MSINGRYERPSLPGHVTEPFRLWAFRGTFGDVLLSCFNDSAQAQLVLAKHLTNGM